jgi:predicted nucleotidyltransferase
MQKKKSLLSKINKWIAREGITDAIIFGSSARENATPGDVDVCLIVPDTMEKKSIDIADNFRKEFGEMHVSIITETDFLKGKHTLVKTLLSEGVSVTSGESLSKAYGFDNKTLFTYSLSGFKPADRVRFHYLLRGRRGTKGILDEIKAEILGDGVMLVPTKKEDILREVLEMWKVKYKTRRILVG